MTYESDAERDFVEFIRDQSDSLDVGWAEIMDRSLDIRAIIEPIFERVGGDASEAQALGDQYTSSFLGYIRSQNSDIGKWTQSLIIQAVAEGHAPPGSLYAGRYPTHSFNAQAQFVRETRLILIHTGFKRLLIEDTRLLLAIHDKLVPEKVERWPEPSWSAAVTLEDLIEQLSELLVSLVADAEPEPIYLDEMRGRRL